MAAPETSPAVAESTADAPPPQIPSDAQLVQALPFTVNKVGRKWLEVSVGRYKAKMAITPESAAWQAGKQYTAPAFKHVESSRYGTTITYYPAPASVAKQASAEKSLAEIERWLGYVEDKAFNQGYLYENGVDKLRALGVDDSPEYAERLKKAVAKANEARAAAREAARLRREADQLTRDAARQASKTETGQRRKLYPLSAAPIIGRAIEERGKWVVYESKGKSFRIDESHPSVAGHHLLGYEGDLGAYFYHRDASPEEVEVAKADAARAATAPQGKSWAYSEAAVDRALRGAD